jgi:Arm DNA-binding domain
MQRVRERLRAEKRLRAKEVPELHAGTHEDGGGLRLVVEPPKDKKTPGARRWVLRVTIGGKRYNRGLGPYPLVSLDNAREAATDIRRAAREGRDLLAEREQARARSVSFRQAFDALFAIRQKSLSNAKHLQQWPSTMKTYVFPRIGDKPVSDATATS